MLRLKRHYEESVTIDVEPSAEPTRIIVKTLAHNRTNTTLGFEAPRDRVRILRTELLENPAPEHVLQEAT